jgi:hypothetical protein
MKVLITERTSKEIIDRLMVIGDIEVNPEYGYKDKDGMRREYYVVYLWFNIEGRKRRLEYVFYVDKNGNIPEKGINISWPSPQDITPFNMVPPDIVQDYFMDVARKYIVNKVIQDKFR